MDQLRAERFHPVDSGSTDETRTEFRRDRDRILYSSAFRRLSGITQVISPSGSHPTHNRLTHSLEVAQIARSIAERLLSARDAAEFEAVGGLDPDVVDAAALAHDLGHPPFGHVAETTINDELDKDHLSREGFEGNAQSFRIVNKLSTRYLGIDGLNLTRATLSAMSKYPWCRENTGIRSTKWGSYDSEREILHWSRDHLPKPLNDKQTIEAEIMDYADDVAYAVHDLEDFFRAGLVPLDKLRNNTIERDQFLASYFIRHPSVSHSQYEHVFEDLVKLFPVETYVGSHLSKAELRSVTSGLIGRFILAFEFDATSDTVLVHEQIRTQINLLKGLTWHYVIDSRALLTTRHGYSTIIKSLFDLLSEAARATDTGARPNLGIFPDFFREQLEQGQFSHTIIARTVADTIASLTEAQAISLHQRLTGQSLGAVLDPIL